MNLNISSALRTTKSVITANSPALLVGATISSIVATGYLAAKGGYKARGVIDAAELERDAEGGPELTTMEKAQLTWLCYAPSALTGAAGVLSVVGVHTIHTKRQAAMAGLYAVATAKLDETREEAEKLLGPKKAQQLNDITAQRSMDRGEPLENNEVIITKHGQDLCYDDWSGRYFLGSYAKIESACIELNKKLLNEGEATLNEFYDFLGLPPIEMGESYGWSGVTIEPRFASVTAGDGRPAVSFRFQPEPKTPVGKR